MIKHKYTTRNDNRVWEIAKVGNAYYATLMSLPTRCPDGSVVVTGEHLAPFTYGKLRWAKESIDSGEAYMTASEKMAALYLSGIRESIQLNDQQGIDIQVQQLHDADWRGVAGASLALEYLGIQ